MRGEASLHRHRRLFARRGAVRVAHRADAAARRSDERTTRSRSRACVCQTESAPPSALRRTRASCAATSTTSSLKAMHKDAGARAMPSVAAIVRRHPPASGRAAGHGAAGHDDVPCSRSSCGGTGWAWRPRLRWSRRWLPEWRFPFTRPALPSGASRRCASWRTRFCSSSTTR